MRLEVGIIALVADVLGVPAERHAQFEWLRNKPTAEHFGDHYPRIRHLFEELGGDRDGLFGKADGYLTPDAYFPEPYHFIFEFDELQHFTAPRQRTLTLYPANAPLAFDRGKYLRFCEEHHEPALRKGTDRFRRKTADFPFVNGRAAQRAFFDTFRDWLPPLHGLRPTLRIAEFEVAGILRGELTGRAARDYLAALLEERHREPYFV
ncbi:MAG: hypothetical protein OXN17_03570 [Candidatus Poribacteria bacterium]|nr:hypothetical protein [Candidatus Poribacteria bacterium]MDE0504982.1 hypothetical protein [Candidatus Poribacteria bacterium]